MIRSFLPRRTVRLRLTILYASLFVVSGAAVLGLTYWLMRHAAPQVVHATQQVVAPGSGSSGPRLGAAPAPAGAEEQRQAAAALRDAQLHDLLERSAVALAIMAVLSAGLGWLVAGRVLRPLRVMTARTRTISDRTLSARLAVPGPRDEITDLAATIDALLDRLEAAFAAQQRFVANASHELRTPLAMMRTSLDVAAAKPVADLAVLDAKLREGLDRADALLEDFLLLARAEAGAVPEREPVDLAALMREAAGERVADLEASGLQLTEPEVAAPALVNAALVRHLARGLVDNAIRHNVPGGAVAITTGSGDGEAWVRVDADGAPIDPATVSELVQPFRRGTGERTAAGHGLGLSIARAIAEAHGGRLQLGARPGGGLTVTATFPAAVVPAAAYRAVRELSTGASTA